ncbi:hypothetical protein [Vibrio sp. 10N.247.311.59]|uniref:hypothetical protein n=1 Tax=Vibrio sp. 10N.247.311.59 TaxID=3229989 RepID=UPI00354CE786
MLLRKIKFNIKRIKEFIIICLRHELIYVVGDSHCEVFNYINKVQNTTYYKVLSIQGATVSGLSNPNSKTQAFNIINKHLSKKRNKKIILMFGEVDTGFVIWYRNQFNQISIEKALSLALDNYSLLIERTVKQNNVCVISAPLPTISDGIVIGEVSNLRSSIKASQKERTRLTLKFNKAIEDHCKSTHGAVFINLDEDSLDDGIVKKSLLNKNRADHHYDHKEYSKLLLSKIGKVFE